MVYYIAFWFATENEKWKKDIFNIQLFIMYVKLPGT